jgi:hypothetical protein
MEKKGGIGDRKVFRRLFHNRQEVILKRVLVRDLSDFVEAFQLGVRPGIGVIRGYHGRLLVHRHRSSKPSYLI